MIYISKNKFMALLCYAFINTIIFIREGWVAYTEASLAILGIILIPIFFPGIFAFFASWGFIESLAKDSRNGVSPGWISLISWLFFIILSLFLLFKWRLY